MEFLGWMLDPARMGEWAGAARLIPASKSAFAQAMAPVEYAEVMWNLLEDALVAPEFSRQAPYAEAWHNAVSGVLSGQLAPDDAAFRAVQAITQ
jgi:ABC-type glycerol-3-phosphate transport system substrate-binding protein